MATDRGLGRTLADIRADIDTPPVRGVLEVPQRGALGDGPLGRLIRDAVRLTEGAEPRADEFAELTAGEAWGMLLEMPPDKRLAWLGNILEAARTGSACIDQGHRARIAALEERALPRLLVERLKRRYCGQVQPHSAHGGCSGRADA